MKIFKVSMVLAACSLLPLQAAFSQSGRFQPTIAVQAELLSSQTLPVHVTMAKLQNFDTGSELLINLKKVDDLQTSGVLIGVYVSHGGLIRHGQGMAVDLTGNKSANMSFRVQTLAHLVTGDTALVFVQGVRSPAGNQGVPEADVITNIKAFAQGKYSGNFVDKSIPSTAQSQGSAPTLKPGSQFSLGIATPNFADPCAAAQTGAEKSCGDGGGRLASFSCSPATGDYSFSCVY